MTQPAPEMPGGPIYLGIDVGSTTVKVVVLDQDKHIIEKHYRRSRGQSAQTVYDVLSEIFQRISPDRVAQLGLTGSGGEVIASLLGGSHINEVVAQTRAVGEFCPQARTVIEMGGQDSKLLILERDEAADKTVLVDFAMNNLCAAGTGSFLDQQADRLGVDIETEFESIALQSSSPARIAGRCTVFAKSDMIHLQQKGIPLPDILAGLCHAVARNYKGTIGKGKKFERPVVFQGGVAYNKAMIRAFENVLGLKPGELIIPQNHNLMSALGTAFIAMDTDTGERTFAGLGPLADYLATERSDRRSMPPLTLDGDREKGLFAASCALPKIAGDEKVPVYLGVDVGSISTNVVLIDKNRTVVARRYLRTEGKPLEAVKEGMAAVGAEVGDMVEVIGVGVTGSGRHLTGHFVGADVVRNEITAQATAAAAIDPTVDTIFEIGGQDSKYIRMENGAIVDFEMNKACAAGTGSFLEEQADKLRINIERDFAELALSSKAPSCLGQRCTVFMESDLVAHQQRGAKKDELVAGLGYSIVMNYLNNVVKERRVGKNIFFQGGVAWNKAVVAAFEQMLGKSVTVPPHHDVTGAIGAAILAMQGMNGAKTKFRGFDLSHIEYDISSFECRACPNICEVSKVIVAGSEPIFFGARCEKFEDTKKLDRSRGLPDLFEERERLLFGKHYKPSVGSAIVPEEMPAPSGRPRVGIPRVLSMYDMFPYWSAFFEAMGADVVLSDATNPDISHVTTETAVVDSCFPIKVVHGHALNLVDKGVDYVFVPSIVSRERTENHEQCYLCPYVQAVPYVLRAAIDFDSLGVKLLTPYIRFLFGERDVRKSLEKMAREIGLPATMVRRAMQAGQAAQREFEQAMKKRGREVLGLLEGDQLGVVVVGRPYNTCDPGLNMDLPAKLRALGIIPIPLDFLPVSETKIVDDFSNMYWFSGQRIIAAAKLGRENENLYSVYLTSYGCGPDSFIISFYREGLAGKPFLELEIDDHSGDAGTVTRCEAFFDSINGLREAREQGEKGSVAGAA